MRSLLAILMAAFLVGGFAGTAAAQSPTQDAYGGVLGEQVEDDDATPPASEPKPAAGDVAEEAAPVSEPVVVSRAQTGSSLPFTGLDLALVVLIGVGLLGLGFGLRRASRSTPA